MQRLTRCMRNAWNDERGTEVLEWGLVAGLIVVGAIAAMVLIGPKVATIWNNANALIP